MGLYPAAVLQPRGRAHARLLQQLLLLTVLLLLLALLPRPQQQQQLQQQQHQQWQWPGAAAALAAPSGLPTSSEGKEGDVDKEESAQGATAAAEAAAAETAAAAATASPPEAEKHTTEAEEPAAAVAAAEAESETLATVAKPQAAAAAAAAAGRDAAGSVGDADEQPSNEAAAAAEAAVDKGIDSERDLITLVEDIAAAAAAASAAANKLVKDFNTYKDACEAKAESLEQRLNASAAELHRLAVEVRLGVGGLRAVHASEVRRLVRELGRITAAHRFMPLYAAQNDLRRRLVELQQSQEATAREVQHLNASYTSLEDSLQEQLKAAVAAAQETSASSYHLLAERLRELAAAKVEEVQREYNQHRLDEAATDRIITEIISQLKKKGVAVVDFSDVFADYSFEVVRQEFMVRMSRRINAYFLPVFIVTQTAADMSDWLYSQYHLVPSMRLLEIIIDELAHENDRDAYAVVQVQSVNTEVLLRRAQIATAPPASSSSSNSSSSSSSSSSSNRGGGIAGRGNEGASGRLSHAGDVQHQQQQQQQHSLLTGRLLPVIAPPSQEALVVATSASFGAEVVKRFDDLTKTYLRSAVGGQLAKRAVLIVYLGERPGEIPRLSPGPQEVAGKLEMAEKLCTAFSAPSQEVAALWRQMEAEVPFYSAFFRQDPLVFDSVPVSVSFDAGKLPPLPPSPLFRGEFGIVQVQALRTRDMWHVPSAGALEAAVAFLNSRQERGGVQVLVRVVEERVMTFWRTVRQYDVRVFIRSADSPIVTMKLCQHPESSGAAALTSSSSGTQGRLTSSSSSFSSAVNSSNSCSTSRSVVVSLAGEGAVRQYLTQALAKIIIPSIGPRITFRRLLIHVCIANKTC